MNAAIASANAPTAIWALPPPDALVPNGFRSNTKRIRNPNTRLTVTTPMR
jgi:hypothetical protein